MNRHWFRWWWCLLLIPMAIGVARLRFDVEILNLLPDIRVVEGLKVYQQHFTNSRELIVTVRMDNADDAASTAQSIAESLRRETNLISDVTWKPPWLEHPEQTAELIASLWLNQPPEIVRQLADGLVPEKLSDVLAATRDELSVTLSPAEIARLSYDPYGLTRLPDNVTSGAPGMDEGQQLFSSPDGKFRVLFLKSRDELNGYRECTDWFDAIKKVVNAVVPPNKQTSIGYTGRPAFVAEISGSMKQDIILSVGGTAVIIGILFWLAHRRLKPMLWLLTLLAVILAGTLALGGLFFGTINVVSMGFAAILLGLAVDYGVIHYQEALAHPNASVFQIRRAIAPSIFWAAFTTISAFVLLNFSGLPGLAQLGSLVGIGVIFSACVMIFAFLPPLFSDRLKSDSTELVKSSETKPVTKLNPRHAKAAFIFSITLVLFCAVILFSGLPGMDASADALRPRNSQAYATLDALKENLSKQHEPLWIVISGKNESEVARQLDAVEPILAKAVSNQVLKSFTLPTALWPRPDFQLANRAALQQLVNQSKAMHDAAATNGFAPDALGLTDQILGTWQHATITTNVYWPTNPLCSWILERLAAREPEQFFAVGFLFPVKTEIDLASFSELELQLPQQNVWLSSWGMLGGMILKSVTSNLWKLLIPMVLIFFFSLFLAFRRFEEIVLSVATFVLGSLCLLAVMKIMGWSWNLLNLMALPLLLGTCIDYSIFMQLALRRHHGDLNVTHRSVGRALLLCGGTAAAGFGSLGFSNNEGMASLGRICAVGIATNMLLSVYLLPIWWRKLIDPKKTDQN